MDFEFRSLCCHISIAVALMCAMEMAAIVLTYVTNVGHPLMVCHAYNVSIAQALSSEPHMTEHRLCTTNGPLLFWIMLHLFTDAAALVAIQTIKHQLLIPYLITTVLDVLMSSAYICVLFFQIILGDKIDTVLLIFMVFILFFKFYDLICGRRLYWFLQWRFDSRFTPRSTVIRDEDHFQF
ncbi:unnamed protein product [Auanema sp. JU1783]|nr:unnamed protein product [Auanema sp. JU1783]